MRKLTAAALSGAAGLAVTAGAIVPALADDATDDAPDDSTATSESRSFTDRAARLKEALAGLVSDGTITQDQADAAAEALGSSDLFRGGPGDGMRGGPGLRGAMDLEVVAETLGVDVDEVRDLLRNGGTLADIAADQGVETGTLVDALIGAATERLDAVVADGSLDQERADEMTADLESRITTMVEEGMPVRGERGGPMGGPGDRFGAPEDDSATESSLRS